jgi:hypothetical protein
MRTCFIKYSYSYTSTEVSDSARAFCVFMAQTTRQKLRINIMLHTVHYLKYS